MYNADKGQWKNTKLKKKQIHLLFSNLKTNNKLPGTQGIIAESRDTVARDNVSNATSLK